MSRWPYQVADLQYLNTATVPRLAPFSYSCFTYPWSFVDIEWQSARRGRSHEFPSTIRAFQQLRHITNIEIQNSKGRIL